LEQTELDGSTVSGCDQVWWRNCGWTEARRAASGDNYFVNWADVPSVIRLQDGSLAAHWLQKSAAST
jgi:hypothetical protein